MTRLRPMPSARTVVAMLSDAELRELEIQNLRIDIEQLEERLICLTESRSPDASGLIRIIRHEKEKLEKLELEAADDLEMIMKLKDNNGGGK